MEQPVICVIVPVYKAEATLPRCIESVLTQQLPGGLRLILVDDQSPDRSGEICDAYAAKDPRVMVLHRRERGVSGARNAGLRAATGEYIVFLDSDDALRPGALAAALAAQAAAPNAFVLWHYTMQPDDTTPVTTVAHPAQQSDLARLHLDCLIAMPWNKLYRRTYARQLAFDQAYTLGEDLQFVLDYLALLGRCQPDFSYLVLESALTFYDCSRTGTLSTRYHEDYCEIWPRHFEKLNAACAAAACPGQDMMPLHRAELRVLAEGVADILRRDPAQPGGLRRDKARNALANPWLRELLGTMTDGRYQSLTMGEDFSLQAGAVQEDVQCDAIWRSDGTVDQLYLALRLAVAEELTPDAPLVLDDALVRFDDQRMAAAMEILRRMAQTKQIICFTCQNRESQTQ